LRLTAAALTLWRKWKVDWAFTQLIIEDKGSGSRLIQSLKKERIHAHLHHGKFEGDKIMRLTAQAAQFHAGVVHFRQDAPWLGELMVELLGFPGVRHDDQVDSISQALAFVTWRESHRCTVEPLRI
jgi:predicted phage terminase large subunit-like protein